MDRVLALAERATAMDDAAWARHANALSVYTRIGILPLIALAIWSRAWLGWWALIPLTLALLWVWWNPRAFPPPARTDSWASRGTFGERVYLNRAAVPVPEHRVAWARGLSAASALGLPPLVWGLWSFDILAVLLGLVLAIGPKLWFVDRMTWLWQDMRDADPAYRGLERGPNV